MQDFQHIADAPRPPALSLARSSTLAAAVVIVARRGDGVARRKRFGQGFIEQPLVVNRRLDVLADLTLFSPGRWLSGFPHSVPFNGHRFPLRVSLLLEIFGCSAGSSCPLPLRR